MGIVGPVYASVDRHLSRHAQYRSFRAGSLDPADYADWIRDNIESLATDGFSVDDIYLSSRYPREADAFAREQVSRLTGASPIRVEAAIEAFRQSSAMVRQRFDHGPYKTYIFPEEEAIIFAVAQLLDLRSIVVAGSYYGYIAAALAAGRAEELERIVLIDPDAEHLGLATRNIAGFVGAEKCIPYLGTAEAYFGAHDAPFDMLIVDAELPPGHPERGFSGKHIYRDIVEAAAPDFPPGAVLLAHNIMLENAFACDYLAQKTRNNREELSGFLASCGELWGAVTEVRSTEGLGLAFKA